MSIISLKDVWEMYRIKFIIDNKPVLENFWALRDISFEVQKGEALGLIGENGSGKSTILKLISGMLKPDRGCINVSGKVSGLLELGAGFQPELTGRENVYLNFGLFGLTKDQIDDLYDEIVSFASLGKFINAPVKCYSQGMFVRLAFAIAINVNPDILLIDDSLAVGDEYFQKKCVQKVFELKDQGKTIIFVSHDMNILSRICKRVILLRNGQIVKEGLSGEVIPVYSRVVGKREGVGIIENDDLVIIFNNGRLFLNWRNKFITSGSGIYADLDINGRVYSSSQAEWDVKKESDNSFLALGKFYQLGITQEWLVELNDDGIKLRIILSSEELFELPLQSVNFMLSNEYATWFTSGENGIFPDSSEETNFWQSITKTKGAQGSVGLNAGGKTDSAPPSFILKQTESNLIYDVEIFNGNYINNGRILQCKAKRSASAGQRSCFSSVIILGDKDVSKYLECSDSNVLIYGDTKLRFENGKLILTYKGNDLTRSEHLSSFIHIQGLKLYSTSGNWVLLKPNDNKIIAYGNWGDLPFTQIWELEVRDGKAIIWKIGLKVRGEVKLIEQRAQVSLVESYRYFSSNYGDSEFPKDFSWGEVDIFQKCIASGEVKILSDEPRYPALSIKPKESLDNFIKIFNSDAYDRVRMIRIEKVEPEDRVMLSPGEYLFMETKLCLEESGSTNIKAQPIVDINKGNLRLKFDNGSGRIFWKDMEITKKLGFYTSLRHNRRWQDSASCARWKVISVSGCSMKVTGKWLNLPIAQDWEFDISDEGLINCRININIEENVILDRQQTNLMLSEGYQYWFSQGQKEKFPEFSKDVDDDWQQIYKSDKTTERIGVSIGDLKKQSLPSVFISSDDLEKDWMSVVLNSDLYHRGRVLQLLKNANLKLTPGEYLYFKGKIFITEDLNGL